MKKIFSLLVALCATTCLWALTFQSGLLYYNTLSDTTVEVTYRTTSYDNYSDLTAVTIPETVTYGGKTYTVVAISSKAFTYYPNNISSSYKNTSLKLINIPKTVKTIGTSAFSYCTALTTINFLGDGLESIGSSAFSYCTALKSFNFPSTLKTIGGSAFSNSALTGAVNLPEGVTSIGSSAFYSTKMTTLSIGNAVSTIGSYAFQYCSSLTSVTLGNSIATISSYAFENCSSLTSITLPKSVTTIQSYAFANCSKLTTVYLKPTTPPTFTSTNIFPSSAKTFYVPCGTSETYFLSDWVAFTTNFREEDCIKKYTIYVNQDCTSNLVEQ